MKGGHTLPENAVISISCEIVRKKLSFECAKQLFAAE